ncbi:MAG: TlpA family protein disulfide reductase [Flavobacteriaceae bacterium]|nr:TlpA family protein disulfide reductase [Flavobacteriaceae bacterium]
MKKLVVIVAGILLVACGKEEVKKDYVTFSGSIIDQNSDSIVISKKGFRKVIAVNADGTFSDTLKVDTDFYRFYDGGEGTNLFLKNGFDLKMTLNTAEFDESIRYTGEGANDNNFLAEKSLLEEKLFDFEIIEMDKAALNTKMSSIKKEIAGFIDTKKELDTMVVRDANEGIAATVKSYSNYLGDLIALRTNLPKGAPSPVFSNYENHAGGNTSLEELKGKYVYVDVWATWCGPCKAEIPHLKKVEADYHDKNIEFVSVSIDRPKDHEKWITMVNDKELSGVQLFADNNWESQFVKEYFIKGIPRFILIDPNGNVVSPDAPRPSDPKLRTMLEEII